MSHMHRLPDWSDLLKLVVITERVKELGRSHLDVAEAALHGGCRAIQFRDKDITDRAFAEAARGVQERCLSHGALFFVNDRVDVAAVLECGVHLGFNDLEVSLARQVLGPGAIIGYSPETLEEAKREVAAGADYLGIGPVFATATKPDAGEAIGLEGLAAMCDADLAPVVAVGGITPENAAEVAKAGARGMAVVAAVSRADDMKAATVALLKAVGSASDKGAAS